MGQGLDVWRAAVVGISGHVGPDVAQAFLDLLRVSEAPTSRRQMSPGHLTASAFVLAPDGGGLLLIDHVALGRWLQPGGHVEGAEGPVAAAAREAIEETGVAMGPGEVIDLDVHDIPARPARGEPAHRHYDVRVAFRAEDWTLSATDAGVRGARWVAWEALETVGTDASVLRTASRLRAWSLSADRPHRRA